MSFISKYKILYHRTITETHFFNNSTAVKVITTDGLLRESIRLHSISPAYRVARCANLSLCSARFDPTDQAVSQIMKTTAPFLPDLSLLELQEFLLLSRLSTSLLLLLCGIMVSYRGRSKQPYIYFNPISSPTPLAPLSVLVSPHLVDSSFVTFLLCHGWHCWSDITAPVQRNPLYVNDVNMRLSPTAALSFFGDTAPCSFDTYGGFYTHKKQFHSGGLFGRRIL